MINNKEVNFVSAVIYTHNNESDIEKYLKSIVGVLEENFNKYEIICVDDASTDRSVEIIKTYFEKYPQGVVSLINMSYYQGVESAMNAGVDLSIGDFVFEFDCVNIDYKIETIMDVYKQSLLGYDIVSACPKDSKRMSSRIFYWLYNKNAFLDNELRTETFRVLSRRAVNRIKSLNTNTPYRQALYSNCGLKHDKVIYEQLDTRFEHNKTFVFNYRKELAIDTLMMFTCLPQRISMIFSCIFLVISIMFLGINIFEGFLKANNIIIMCLSLGMSCISLLSFIIIRYLALLIRLVFFKKEYVISSVDKINKF